MEVRGTGSFPFLGALFAPLVWVLGFLVLAGILSLPHQFSVKPGTFRRDVNDGDVLPSPPIWPLLDRCSLQQAGLLFVLVAPIIK